MKPSRRIENMEIVSQDQITWLVLLGLLIMLLLSLSLILFFNFSQKKILAEKTLSQEKELEHQKTLLHSVLTTQEEERKRIAKDLHDDIGSKLNVIRLNMHQLKRKAAENPDLITNVQEVNELLGSTIQTTRRISHDLLPPTLENFGLVEAIKELKESINKGKPGFVDFEEYDELNKPLDKITALHLFRIVQELITNSLKYAEAKKLTLNLQLLADQILLKYKDDGKGMDIEDLHQLKGLGFKNIDSRLSLLGATIAYESSPNNGFQAYVTLNTT